MQIANTLPELIGNTPLLRLERFAPAAEIQQYMAFRDVLRIVQQRDREERLPAKQRTGDSFPEHPPRQGGRSRER